MGHPEWAGIVGETSGGIRVRKSAGILRFAQNDGTREFLLPPLLRKDGAPGNMAHTSLREVWGTLAPGLHGTPSPEWWGLWEKLRAAFAHRTWPGFFAPTPTCCARWGPRFAQNDGTREFLFPPLLRKDGAPAHPRGCFRAWPAQTGLRRETAGQSLVWSMTSSSSRTRWSSKAPGMAWVHRQSSAILRCELRLR